MSFAGRKIALCLVVAPIALAVPFAAVIGGRAAMVPAFNLPPAVRGIAGLSSRDLANGSPHLLNLFASWCGPCQDEAPYLHRIAARGIPIYAIAEHDNADDLAAFLGEHGNPYLRIGNDPQMAMEAPLGADGLPETLVINGQGRIIYRHEGDIAADDVHAIESAFNAAR